MRAHASTSIAGLIAILASAHPAGADSRDTCPDGGAPLASVVTLDGAASGTAHDGTALALVLGARICPGDTLTTGEDGRIELRFSGKETTVGIPRNASLGIPARGGPDVELRSGLLRFLSSVRDYFEVQTRHANAGIDGTEAVIAVDGPAADTLFVVQEGDVTISARTGESLSLARGQAGFISQNAALALATPDSVPAKFRGLVVAPEGAADWAIHFPPVLTGADAPKAARAAADRLDAGDPDGAEALLAGRTDAASLALASVIAVLRNRPDEGAALAVRARAADPGLAAADIAESYALQARRRVSEARAAAARAVGAHPADTGARARLAELLLTEGDRAGALAALAPIPEAGHTALSRAVEGLAALSTNDIDAAVTAFRRGIALDSEAPLPRLGLGLAMIRSGRLAEGRREIELANALDPRRASLRVWLGRAYAAEGLPEKAASQFAEAKARDPDDPTPWLFAGEQDFAGNRPVSALAELREAELRAAGRAPIRSEAGLGEDRAVIGASQGRVDELLGFDDEAIGRGAAAAEADPTSPAAHYLLAEVLGTRHGREASRTSALLQAQVYDVPGKRAIRPSLAETDLALLETPGAARASFAEFSPFFDADGVRADIHAEAGTQSTRADEMSFSALAGGVSVGVGQFHYETDGYALNNGVRHDILSLQGRAEVTPWLDLFGEFRYRDTEAGDREVEFDLSLADPSYRADDERRLGRVGFHAELGPAQDLAGVFTYVDQASLQSQSDSLGFFRFENSGHREGFDAQLQHVGRIGSVTTVSGLGFSRVDTDLASQLFLFGVPIPPLLIDGNVEHATAYGYATLRPAASGPFAGVELTLGLSVDSYDDGLPGGRDAVEVNPKLGLRGEPIEGVTLRAAYTRTVTPVAVLDQRLEPATVAGFAQFFDAYDGAVVEQVAGGVEVRLAPWLVAGGELAWRGSRSAVFGGNTGGTEEREARLYADATMAPGLATRLSLAHERSISDLTVDLDRFEVTELRGRAGWFDPGGFFAAADLGYVWHEFRGFGRAGSDDFPIAELALGYRLPEGRGVAKLAASNLFDSNFHFEDRPLATITTTAADPRYARDFTLIGSVRLNF